MKPVIETSGTDMTVFLPAELDHPASDIIRRETDRIMGKIYIRTIIFDFAETKFMDSSGIGLIMGRYSCLILPLSFFRQRCFTADYHYFTDTG